MDISTFCNSTSTSALVKLGLGLLVLALKLFCSVSEVAFALPVECAHVAIACPYKELAGRFCMQVQVHEKARSIKNTFPGVHESGGDLFGGWSFEVGKKIFKKTLKKMFENEVQCFLTTQCFQLLNCIKSHCIESYQIVLNRFYQHASFLVSYRAHVSRYESDRLCHERFTPLLTNSGNSTTYWLLHVRRVVILE